MNPRRVLGRALSGSKHIRFAEMVALVQAFGFELDRINGSLHIFKHPRLRDRVNLQCADGKAKPY